jgi:molybdopterin-guanine dinucleotide biosynthesis protein A
MGSDKALLPLHGKSLIELVLQTFTETFSRVVISVRQEHAFPKLAVAEVVDRYKEMGPIGGITSVLESGESQIFCAACDMPFLNPALIKYLCRLPGEAIIPVWEGKQHVLHAVYSVSLLSSFQSAIERSQYRITAAIPQDRIRYVAQEEIALFDPSGLSFRNVNTPADYQEVIETSR